MPAQFVVVGGSPRSGTSLLRTVLRSHTSLFVHDTEPQYILDLYERFGRVVADVPAAVDFVLGHEKFPKDIAPAALRQTFNGTRELTLSAFLRACLALLPNHGTAPLVLKDPTLILHLDLVKELFPNLAVIQCIRDPRANVMSQRTRWPSTSVWQAATRWRASVRAGRAWQRLGGSPYLEVRYEDLVCASETTCRSVCTFLQIPYEPSMLTFDHVEREWNPAKPGEGSKRHYQGFERARIDKWKTFLTPLEVKLIEDRCRQGMAWFGYETTKPSVALGEYVPFYLKERRRAIKKSIRRMKRRLRGAVRLR